VNEFRPIEPDLSSIESESSIQQKAENSTLDGGMQAAIGDNNNQNQSNSSSSGNIVNVNVSVNPQTQEIERSPSHRVGVRELDFSSRKTLLGCSFQLVVLGFVVSITLLNIVVNKQSIPPFSSPRSLPKSPSSPMPPISPHNIEDDPFRSSINYQELKSLLRESRWEEADQKTRFILLKFSDSQKKGFLTVGDFEEVPCTSLYLIDELWRKYSYGQFGLNVQSEIWEMSGENYIAFSQYVGWLDNGLWSSPQKLDFGSLPRATWWGIMDKSEGAEAAFYKIRRCERELH